jgi:hexulose-6-phosphate isomerase
MFDRLGFMQGRLSPLVNKRIQAFPHNHWREEFSLAKQLNLSKIEWTIDSQEIENNPLINESGWKEVRELLKLSSITVPSVTCDYFMENPFWQGDKGKIKNYLSRIMLGMYAIGANILVIPLVDNSSIGRTDKFDCEDFSSLTSVMLETKVRIAFEVDLNPIDTLEFISCFDSNIFGINYDIGNSAALGFDPVHELASYGDRVINVHVKDRELHGNTVRLGNGAAKFQNVTSRLCDLNYQGNYIFQTARASNGNHFEELQMNIKFFSSILARL